MTKTGADETISKVDYCITHVNIIVNNKIRKKIDYEKHMRTRLDNKNYQDMKKKLFKNE